MKPSQSHRRKQYPFYCAFALTVALLAGFQTLFNFDIPPFPEPNPNAELVQVTVDRHDTPSNVQSFTDANENDSPIASELTDTEDTLIAVEPRIPTSLRRTSRMWSYQECFPDSQATQLSAAILNGISPAQKRSEIAEMVRRHELVNITQSPFYAVDKLHHSMPYLVPKAQQLLNTIAINFLDSLRSKGLPPHKPIVSSVLRTTEDVSLLQRGNKNATTNSCHSYGTTIDITYHRFAPINGNKQLTRYDDNLKFVLAEVLYDLRLQGRCYVKYEYKQACFHLTVR